MNKLQHLLLLLLVSSIASQQFHILTEDKFEQMYSKFQTVFRTSKDFLRIVDHYKPIIKKLFVDPVGFMHSQSNLSQLLHSTRQRLLQQQSSPQQASSQTIQCNKKESPNFFKFLPADYLGTLKVDYQQNKEYKLEIEGKCFKNTSFTGKYKNQNDLELTISSSKSKGWLCHDLFFIGSGYNFHVDMIIIGGRKKVVFEGLTEQEKENIKYYGLQVFGFCDNLMNLIPDLLMTVGMFLGGLGTDPHKPFIGSYPTYVQEYLNRLFIERSVDYKLNRRSGLYRLDLDKKEIKNGCLLSILRLDGLDQIIEYGTGSRSGHTAVALWIDHELYILESQDGWYWPQHGIQKTKYDQWIQWAQNAGFQVTISWLNHHNQQIIDQNIQKAIDFFEKLEGLPYGYSNFLFSWIDNVESIPHLLDHHLLGPAFSLLNQFLPETVDLFIGEAYNKRLNTTDLSISDCLTQTYKTNQEMIDILSIVEKEGWVYKSGQQYVCSCFVAGVYKAAGVLDIKMEATEFTPRDIYQVDLFRKQPSSKPQKCIDDDDQTPYCQILGKYKLELDNFSTIEPYDNMNNNCPSQAPLFYRPPRC